MDSARSKDVCTEGYSELIHSADKGGMVDCYLAHPDWCMKHDYPTLDIIREHFADCEGKGVFVDRNFKGETLCGLQSYVFHKCRGTVRVAMDYDKAIIPMLYLANGCRLRIICDQKENKGAPIKVPVYVFGKNDVKAKDNKYAIFTIYKKELI